MTSHHCPTDWKGQAVLTPLITETHRLSPHAAIVPKVMTQPDLVRASLLVVEPKDERR